ncbi:MAG: 1-acyl-sn-glycerol-3-phosphate acyltransferase [Candidatus Moduliflexus flocculans]|nr:1-acyl-sn-glycerol-3-phosphate acyltransferase [Candidatus Moduliflexus flocculans]
MARKQLVALGYILVFWGVLPGILVILAAWGERVFGPGLPMPNLVPTGLTLAGVSGVLLALSIVQYTRASGHLPISAFPPQRLIRSGVFGLWRHPIYLFFILFFGGFSVVFWPTGAVLAAVPALVAMTFVYARLEESGLERRFGSLYRGHRRQTAIVVPRLIQFVRAVFAGLSRLFFRLEVLGREHIPEPPFIVVSAHRSFLDPFFILVALGTPVHFITTSGMFRTPLSRFVFSRLLCLPATRYKADVRNALEIRRRLHEGCIVGMFPEAERSWTGSMIGFKPEAVRLLGNLSAIPILPVRLQGTYAVWPRWARCPRRARVSVRIGTPFFAGNRLSPGELESRLSGLMAPQEGPVRRSSPISARGIEAVIYRCPECLCFDSVHSGKGAHFECSSCLAEFTLFSDFSVQRSGDSVRSSLADLSRRIRPVSGGGLTAGEPKLSPARAKLSRERNGRLEAVGAGHLNLSALQLMFEPMGPAVCIDLRDIRSLVIEGARKLEVYGGRPARLYQFTLVDQSALKWQDVIGNAIRHHFGASPSPV